MASALVIGASRGIGREFVRQLLALDWKVSATARDARHLEALQASGCRAIALDVADAASIAAFIPQLDSAAFDLILYVAGVYGPEHGARIAPQASDFDRIMHANVLGAMQLIPALAPKLEASGGKFIFLSSEMASIADTPSSTGWVYRSSKAALNMAVKAAAFDYPRAILVALSPGWVKTEMGGPGAPLAVEESVAGMLEVIGRLRAHDSGSFYHYNGEQLAW